MATFLKGRAEIWRLRTRSLDLRSRPLLMGVVNVTPDSFSDGGRFLTASAAVEHGLRLVEEGADILDIGGESTRPYAEHVSPASELDRILPVVEELARRTETPLSIDTTKASVARAAVAAGAEIINEISALTHDPDMLQVARETGVGVCAMHMRGTPQTMQDDPTYENVVEDVLEYLAERRDALLDAGIERARICLDPGVGFGKTTAHNLALLSNCMRFHALGCPIVVGHSRKGFLGKVMGHMDRDRTAATIGGALALAVQGVQIIRVHDVQAVRDALVLFHACGGYNG